MDQKRQFLALDALRGLAALAVLELHSPDLFGKLIFVRAHLAVDFFFMLSGFVLTFAYQQKLDAGWSSWSFIKVRLIRLYPLYLLGLVLGFLFFSLQSRYQTGHVTSRAVVEALVFGALFLPNFSQYNNKAANIFPLNSPAWSLFEEMLMNVIHALFLRRRTSAFLLGIAGVSAIAVVLSAVRFQTFNFGWASESVWYGITRILFAYTVGMLLFRLFRSGRLRTGSYPLLCCVALLGALAVPMPPRFEVGFEIVIVLLAFPTILFFAAGAKPSGQMGRVFHVLGVTSYSLYVIHVPVEQFFNKLWRMLATRTPEQCAPWSGLMYAGGTILLALLLDHVYDKPVRAWLNARLNRSRQP